jgi:hypothetical protein
MAASAHVQSQVLKISGACDPRQKPRSQESEWQNRIEKSRRQRMDAKSRRDEAGFDLAEFCKIICRPIETESSGMDQSECEQTNKFVKAPNPSMPSQAGSRPELSHRVDDLHGMILPATSICET